MNGLRDGAAIKRERMMRILEYVRKNPGMPIERIQAWVSFNIGLNPKTTVRYLSELVMLGKLEESDNGFRVPERKKPKEAES